jgi:hypothetical protein
VRFRRYASREQGAFSSDKRDESDVTLRYWDGCGTWQSIFGLAPK